NARVPALVVHQFNLYCVKNFESKKAAFNKFTKYFLEKYKSQKLQKQRVLHDEEIDFKHLQTTNFEINKEFILELKLLKVNNKLSLQDIYTQIIIHYLNNNHKID